MKCLQCSNEAVGKSKYCSDSCKTLYNRNKNHIVTPSVTGTVTPSSFGTVNCQCQMCKANKDGRLIINHGKPKSAAELLQNEVNWVSLPGDSEYFGCCIKDKDGKTWGEKRDEIIKKAAGV